MIKAELNRYRQAPRKVRLLADLVKGKPIEKALAEITFSGKRAAEPLKKLINSAVANAVHNHKLSPESLYVKNITVNGGQIMKRGMPRAFGRSFLIKKRTSKISVELGVKEEKKDDKKEVLKKKVISKKSVVAKKKD